MKKYPKMTFAALSAIALNFSCLAMVSQLNNAHEQNPNEVICIHDNFQNRELTPLSTEKQIVLLKSAIRASNVHLAEIILKEYIGKTGRKYYYMQIEGNFFDTISDEQFKDLQLFSLNDLKKSDYCGDSFDNKRKIFQFITSKFFEVTKNKEDAYQTTANKIYHNLDSFCIDNLGALIDLPPSPEDKMEIAKQLLSYAKQDNNIINAYSFIFLSLESLPFISYTSTSFSSFLSIFRNQPWLLEFISEYLELALNDTTEINLNGMPIDFIKNIAPALYYKKFPAFIEKSIKKIDKYSIDLLLPRNENTTTCDIPRNVHRLSSEYLDSALFSLTWINRSECDKEEDEEEDILSGDVKDILSSIALYTDPSSDLTDVALTLTRLTKKKCESALECIKTVNSVLHDLLLEEIQCLKDMNFQPNRVAGLKINEVQDHLLSTEEQSSLLQSAISASKIILVKRILNGYIGKIDSKYYYLSPEESRQEDFFKPMSDQQFEELQLFSLDEFRRAHDDNDESLDDKLEILELITAKFFEVTNNKEQVSKTTASKVYSNRDSFGADELGDLIDTIPFPDSKIEFVRQFLNDAKQDNHTDEYECIFWALETLFEMNIFTNQPWLQPFISKYLEQMLSDTANLNYMPPIDFIKEAAPDLYNEKFPAILKKCITDGATDFIEVLLPIDDRNNKYIPLEDRRLSSEYLNLALEGYHGIDTISSYIASYTDTSSDLTNVAQTLTSFTQKERKETLEGIKNANSVLHDLLLEKL